MDLATIWFVLIAVLWSGYFVLEGFDFGVGMLLAVLPRDEAERSTMFESIGPVWDGNEVWLVVAGASMFAAFPNWYASWFSALYLALWLLLAALIVRGVSFEFRGKFAHQRGDLGGTADADLVGKFGGQFLEISICPVVVGMRIENHELDLTGWILGRQRDDADRQQRQRPLGGLADNQ
jgi:cytochrome d oxidase subunit CydB